MADLSSFPVSQSSDAGAEVTVRHPTSGDELDIKIRVVGPDSRKAREATRAMTDNLTKEAMEHEATPDDAAYERMAAQHAAALTISWEHVEWDGQPFPFSQENAVKLYTEHRWIREQVEQFAGKRANFFRPSKAA